MSNLELIQTANRRLGRMDRRRCEERRRHPVPATNTVETIETLRVLLDESHARIRALEQAVETLKISI